MKTFQDFINIEFALLDGIEWNDDTIYGLKQRIIKDMRMMIDHEQFYNIISSMITERANYLAERDKLLSIPKDTNP